MRILKQRRKVCLLFWKWVWRGLAAYVLALVTYGAWPFAAATQVPAVLALETRLLKPVVGFVFSSSSANVGLNPISNGEQVPRDPRVSSRETIDDVNDVDRFLFVLDGFDSARENELIKYFKLDAEEIAALEPGSSMSRETIALRTRLHPLPFYVQRKSFAFVDMQYLAATYRSDCVVKILYDFALNMSDQDFKDGCERSSGDGAARG
ncbi:hypothetical protein [Tateyamaria sp. syn59]|uniref:hypothetical protein n=1 Tax=Tateyamaria sp. syn59 TaxID=2576942 RepID=UPI0011BF5C70|nr:hypothetical protein [Tateyamaria sp. syn59]